MYHYERIRFLMYKKKKIRAVGVETSLLDFVLSSTWDGSKTLNDVRRSVCGSLFYECFVQYLVVEHAFF